MLHPHLTASAPLAKQSCWIGRVLDTSGQEANPNYIVQNVKSWWQTKLLDGNQEKVKGGQQMASEGLHVQL